MEKVKEPFLKSCTLCQLVNQEGTKEISLAQVYELITLIKTELCSTLEGPLPV